MASKFSNAVSLADPPNSSKPPFTPLSFTATPKKYGVWLSRFQALLFDKKGDEFLPLVDKLPNGDIDPSVSRAFSSILTSVLDDDIVESYSDPTGALQIYRDGVAIFHQLRKRWETAQPVIEIGPEERTINALRTQRDNYATLADFCTDLTTQLQQIQQHGENIFAERLLIFHLLRQVSAGHLHPWAATVSAPYRAKLQEFAKRPTAPLPDVTLAKVVTDCLRHAELSGTAPRPKCKNCQRFGHTAERCQQKQRQPPPARVNAITASADDDDAEYYDHSLLNGPVPTQIYFET